MSKPREHFYAVDREFIKYDMTLVYREIRRHPEQIQPAREVESNISDYTGARR